jgi:hypothetical protein|tara:strand:- start:4683 stop:4907 length:225 start_codon:yes stop_codon:yes gene_type:complete
MEKKEDIKNMLLKTKDSEIKKLRQDLKYLEHLKSIRYEELKTVATEYSDYCRDVRHELMDRPMNFDEWYAAYNK